MAALSSIDGKALSSLAKKVTKVKKTNNHELDSQRQEERDQLVRMIDCFVKYPTSIQPMHSHMLALNLHLGH
eukprot:10969235-Lingulodinium_polyedra.AAC.1